MKNHLDQQDGKLDELMEITRDTRQRLACLEHGARQQRYAMEIDVPPDTRTRKRAEDAGGDRVMNGDRSSVKKVDSSPMSSTIFRMTA